MTSDQPSKRTIDMVVISDLHLGTPSCQANRVWDYLRSIRPRILILNGDVCDIGSYWRNHWPREHLMVMRRLLKIAASGAQVYYLIGNHDAPARKFHGISIGNVHIRDRLELCDDQNRRTLVVHGDCFDGRVACPRWLHALGGWSYERAMGLSHLLNIYRRWRGRPPLSLASVIKNNVSLARNYIERFRATAVGVAAKEDFDTIITGHIHQPDSCHIGDVHYLNSGDWVENCTALEYHQGGWHLHHHPQHDFAIVDDEPDPDQQLAAALEKLLVAAA